MRQHWDNTSQLQTSTDNVSEFTIKRVKTKQELINKWEPVLKEIFTDENDRESTEELIERLDAGTNFFMLLDKDGSIVGVECAQISTDKKFMYVPWTGVLESFRNYGVGTKMNAEIASYMRRQYGVQATLLDIEDPDRLHNSAYSAQEMPEAIAVAHRRINYWRRVGDGNGPTGGGFVVVNDTNKPSGQKLEYVRPASDDPEKIQAYDHMAIRFEDVSLLERHMKAQRDGIAKSFVRQCYLAMTCIQYGDLDEDTLRRTYPAVDQYLSAIDAIDDQYLNIDTRPILPKKEICMPVRVTMDENLPAVTAVHTKLAP